MVLTCDECEWRFRINAALIKDTGSYVKCSKCGNIWQIYPEITEEEILILESMEEILDQPDAENRHNEIYEPGTREYNQLQIIKYQEPGFEKRE